MLNRAAFSTALRLAQGFPVLAITGPRQSGKTTMARALFAGKPYVSLEDPEERSFADSDPRGFLARFPQGAILDEVQRCPGLFSYLQGVVDERRRMGEFIITGSQQFGLMSNIAQSLAGRVGLLQLLPFSLAGALGTGLSLDESSLSFGVSQGALRGTVIGRVIDSVGRMLPGRRWTLLDIGLSWRTPWQGELSLGTQSYLAPQAEGPKRDADVSPSRVPYVQYRQDL